MPPLKSKLKRSAGSPRGETNGRIKTSEIAPVSLAHDPNLIERIKQDIAALGLVGETEASLLIYLVYTSRLLDDPLSIVCRGVSASGKSLLLTKVALLMPPDKLIDSMAGFTTASIFNSPEDEFKHKIILTGERKHSSDDATRDANATIRQLLSEKRVSRTKSVQVDGQWVRELIVREGPVAYCETTTSKSIFEEDLNRMLQIYTDASAEQTRRVLASVGVKHERLDVVDTTAIIDRHRAFQETLVPYTVRIKYGRILTRGISAEKVKSRRIATQIMATIEAVALLHQFQRETKEGFLIATVEDYAVARGLLLKPLQAALGVSAVCKKYERLRKRLKGKEFDSVQLDEAAKLNSRTMRSKLIRELKTIDVIELVTKAKGTRPARYRWIGKTPEEFVLPTPETVLALMRKRA